MMKPCLKTLQRAVLILSLMPGAVWAAIPQAAAPIAALDQGLLQAMQAGRKASFTDRYQMLAPLVENAFDLDQILETSVGPKWQTFTPEQQRELKTEFVRFTVASYVSNFSSFSGEHFEIDSSARDVGAEQVVSTHILSSSGKELARIDYVMRQGEAGWRAVDVLLDGSISRVAVQRSDFRAQLDSGPDTLLSTLTKKVADLSGGASVP